MIKSLETEKWKDLYIQHMIKDFPENELYTCKQFLRYKDLRKVYCYEEEGKEKAYMVTAENDKIIFIHYFAVYKQYRKKGVGTRFLKEYIKMVNSKPILLEIEDPEMSKDKLEYEKRIKRKKFYERLGFIVDNRIKEYFFYEYYLLLTTNKEIPIENVRKEIIEMYRSMTPNYVMKNLSIKIKE